MFRYLSLRIRRPPTTEIALRSGGVLVADVPSQVVPALVVFGDLIDPEYAFLRRLGREERVILDVGAAIGQFTVFAARLGPGVVHACEPSDANLKSLRRNIDRNDVNERVVVHRVALSDVPGEAMFATAATTYMSRLDRTPDIPAAVGDRSVPVALLSEAVDDWGIEQVDVLKVNVAGFEPEVLAGADGLFAAGRVDIVIALVGDRSRQSYERMASFGYRFFFFHPVHVTLHEVDRFDDRFLDERPWPARHVIAVSCQAIHRGVLASMEIV